MSHSGRQSRLSFRDSSHPASPDAFPNLDVEQDERERRVPRNVSAEIEDALSSTVTQYWSAQSEQTSSTDLLSKSTSTTNPSPTEILNALLNHSGSFSVASPTPTDSARGRRGRLPPPISTATSLLERNSISSLPYSPPHSPGYIPTITPSYAPTFTPATTPTATLTPTSLTRDSWRNLSIILESSESSTSLLSTSTSVRVPVQPFENVNPSTVSTIPTAKDTSSILTEPSRQRYGFGLGSPAVDRPRSLSSDMFVGSGSPSVAERVAHFERVSRGNSPSNGLGSSQGLNAPRDTSRRHSSPFPLSGADGHESVIQTGTLWYLDVHVSDPPRWIRAHASLFRTHMQLAWITADGRKGIATLNLVECVDSQSMPTTSHDSMREDIGSVAWNQEANGLDGIYPIHLIFSDGVERLACESLKERLTWAGAIWESLTASNPNLQTSLSALSTVTPRSVSNSIASAAIVRPSISSEDSERRKRGEERESHEEPPRPLSPLHRIISFTRLGGLVRSSQRLTNKTTGEGDSGYISPISSAPSPTSTTFSPPTRSNPSSSPISRLSSTLSLPTRSDSASLVPRKLRSISFKNFSSAFSKRSRSSSRIPEDADISRNSDHVSMDTTLSSEDSNRRHSISVDLPSRSSTRLLANSSPGMEDISSGSNTGGPHALHTASRRLKPRFPLNLTVPLRHHRSLSDGFVPTLAESSPFPSPSGPVTNLSAPSPTYQSTGSPFSGSDRDVFHTASEGNSPNPDEASIVSSAGLSRFGMVNERPRNGRSEISTKSSGFTELYKPGVDDCDYVSAANITSSDAWMARLIGSPNPSASPVRWSSRSVSPIGARSRSAASSRLSMNRRSTSMDESREISRVLDDVNLDKIVSKSSTNVSHPSSLPALTAGATDLTLPGTEQISQLELEDSHTSGDVLASASNEATNPPSDLGDIGDSTPALSEPPSKPKSGDTSVHVIWQPDGPFLPTSPAPSSRSQQEIVTSVDSTIAAASNDRQTTVLTDGLSTSTPAWSIITPAVRADLDKTRTDVKIAKQSDEDDQYKYTSIIGPPEDRQKNRADPQDQIKETGNDESQEVPDSFQFLKAGDGGYDMIRVQRRSPRASPREPSRKPLPEAFLSPKLSISDIFSTTPKQSSYDSSVPAEVSLSSSVFLPSDDTIITDNTPMATPTAEASLTPIQATIIPSPFKECRGSVPTSTQSEHDAEGSCEERLRKLTDFVNLTRKAQQESSGEYSQQLTRIEERIQELGELIRNRLLQGSEDQVERGETPQGNIVPSSRLDQPKMERLNEGEHIQRHFRHLSRVRGIAVRRMTTPEGNASIDLPISVTSSDRAPLEIAKEPREGKPDTNQGPSTGSSSFHISQFPDVPDLPPTEPLRPAQVTKEEKHVTPTISRVSPDSVTNQELARLILRLGQDLRTLANRQKVVDDVLNDLKAIPGSPDAGTSTASEEEVVDPEQISGMLATLERLRGMLLPHPFKERLSESRESVSLSIHSISSSTQLPDISTTSSEAGEIQQAQRIHFEYSGAEIQTPKIHSKRTRSQEPPQVIRIFEETAPGGSQRRRALSVEAPSSTRRLPSAAFEYMEHPGAPAESHAVSPDVFELQDTPQIAPNTRSPKSGSVLTQSLGILGHDQTKPISRGWYHKPTTISWASPLESRSPNLPSLSPSPKMENGRNDVREDVQDGDKDRHGEASPVELQEIGKLITDVCDQQNATTQQQQEAVQILGQLNDWLSKDSADRSDAFRFLGHKLDNLQALISRDVPRAFIGPRLATPLSMPPLFPLFTPYPGHPDTGTDLSSPLARSASTIVPPYPEVEKHWGYYYPVEEPLIINDSSALRDAPMEKPVPVVGTAPPSDLQKNRPMSDNIQVPLDEVAQKDPTSPLIPAPLTLPAPPPPPKSHYDGSPVIPIQKPTSSHSRPSKRSKSKKPSVETIEEVPTPPPRSDEGEINEPSSIAPERHAREEGDIRMHALGYGSPHTDWTSPSHPQSEGRMSRPQTIKFLDVSQSDPIVIIPPREPNRPKSNASRSTSLHSDSRKWSGIPIWRKSVKSKHSPVVKPLPQVPVSSPPSTVRRKPAPVYIEETVPEIREQRNGHSVTVIPLTDRTGHWGSHGSHQGQDIIIADVSHTRSLSTSECLYGRQRPRDASPTLSSERPSTQRDKTLPLIIVKKSSRQYTQDTPQPSDQPFRVQSPSVEHVPGHVGRERSRSRSRSSSHAILLSLEHPKAITSISNLSHTRDGAPALENPDDLPLRGIPREIHQTKGQHQMRDTRRHTYHTVVPSSPSHGIIIRDSAQPGGRPESGLNTLRDAQAPTTGVLHSDVLRRRDKKLRPEEPGQQFTLGRGARPTSNSIRASHTANKSTSEPQVAEMIEVEREENIAQEFTALVAVVAKEQDVVDANAPVYKPMSSLGAKDPSATPRKPGTAVPNVPKRPSPNDSHAKDEKTTSVIPEQDAEPTPRHQASLTPLSQPGPTKEAGGELPQAPSETEAGIIINPVATIRSVGGSVDIVATKVDQQENFSDPQTHRRESFVAVPRSNAPKGSKKAKTGKKRGARSAPDSEPLRGAAATPSDPPEQYKVEETLKYSTDLPSTPPPTTQISSSPNVAVSRASSHPTAIMIPTPNTNPASIPQEAEFEAEIITVPDLAQGKSKGKWNRAQAAQQKQYREADTGLLLPPSNQPNHIEHLDIHPPLSIMPTPIKNSASIASQPRSRQQCIENIAEKGIDVATSSSFPTSSMQSTSCQQAKKLLEDEIRERIRRNEQAMEAAIRIRTHQRELHEERRKAFNLEREIQKAKDELETLRAEKLAADQERMDVVAQAMDKSQSELRQKLGEISNLMSLNHVASLEDPSKVKRSQELDTMEDQQIESIKALIQQISAQNRDQYRQAAEAPNASQTRSDIHMQLDNLKVQNEEQQRLLASLMGQSSQEERNQQRLLLEQFGDSSTRRVQNNVHRGLNQFSGALSTEIRTLLREVGDLREHRRNLQHEIGSLICFRSKMAPGGIFDPNWDPSLGPGCIPTNPQIVSAPEKQTLVVEPRAPSFAEAMPLSKNPSKIKTPTTSQIKPSRSGQNVTPSSKHDQTPSHSIRPPVSPGVTLVAPLTSTSNQGRDSTGRGVTTPSSSRGNTRTVAGPRNPKTTQKRKKDQKLQAD